MWDITEEFPGHLPKNFKLLADEDFFYLYYRDKKIAVFTRSGANVETIEKEAKEYLKNLK